MRKRGTVIPNTGNVCMHTVQENCMATFTSYDIMSFMIYVIYKLVVSYSSV